MYECGIFHHPDKSGCNGVCTPLIPSPWRPDDRIIATEVTAYAARPPERPARTTWTGGHSQAGPNAMGEEDSVRSAIQME